MKYVLFYVRISLRVYPKGFEAMKKCDYCAKEISYFEQYCCDECHREANKYYEKVEKFSKFFGVVNMICVFGIPIGLFMFPFLKIPGTIIATLSCLILGLMLILLPFPTEGMISKRKLKKAISFTRIIGGAVIALGLAILIFLFFFFSE